MHTACQELQDILTGGRRAQAIFLEEIERAVWGARWASSLKPKKLQGTPYISRLDEPLSEKSCVSLCALHVKQDIGRACTDDGGLLLRNHARASAVQTSYRLALWSQDSSGLVRKPLDRAENPLSDCCAKSFCFLCSVNLLSTATWCAQKNRRNEEVTLANGHAGQRTDNRTNML